MWLTVFDRALYLEAAEDLRRNPGQWAAYESEGNCVVLAGPGSGKTKTLAVKIARILAEDVEEPRGLACITYNNECARELERRLADLGIEPGRRLFIGTVHSFSLTQIVLPYARVAQLGLPEDFRIATSTERTRAMERAYGRVISGPDNPRSWELRMSHYRRTILDRDSEEWQTEDPKLARLVEAYEEELRDMRRIDFDDMPLLAVRALRRNAWLQRALLAKYPVLVVDEYQDLGRALHRMVMELCFSADMRLFAVGDPDQSIYGFTGARPELLTRLANRPDVETVKLRLNYRCGTRIVAASRYALGEDRDYEAVEHAEDGTIYFHPRSGRYEDHAAYLCSTLLPDIFTRNPALKPGEIAILYPAAWIGNAVAEAAQANGYGTIRTDQQALYPRGSRLMRWLELCGEWCCGGWRMGTPRFSRVVNEGKRLFAEAIQTEQDLLNFQHELIATLWIRRTPDTPLRQWLEGVHSAFADSRIANCPSLNDEAETLSAFLGRTMTGDCHDMTLRQFAGQSAGNDSLHLTTLHSAKGREFRVVVMFGIDDDRIPRANPTPRQIIEQRRLFYVGFTRAESELHVMYSTYRPSRFVTEVQERLAAGG